jgi:hypothetical protein
MSIGVQPCTMLSVYIGPLPIITAFAGTEPARTATQLMETMIACTAVPFGFAFPYASVTVGRRHWPLPCRLPSGAPRAAGRPAAAGRRGLRPTMHDLLFERSET